MADESVSDVMTVADANATFGIGKTRWMVECGRWQRPYPGVVVLHSGSLTREQLLAAQVLSMGTGTLLAGLTAAETDGLTGLTSDATHILISHGLSRTPRDGIIVHRSRLLTNADIHPSRVPRRTRFPRSIIDAASWASSDRKAVAVIAAAVQQRLVRPGDLQEVVDRMPRVRRRSLIREVITDVSGGSHSGDEVAFLRLCRAHGLPLPTRQRKRTGADGRSWYTDAEFDDYNLAVEIDGRQHIDVRNWWQDMRTQNDLVVSFGKSVLRFPAFVVRHNDAEVAAVLADFFRRVRPDLPIGCRCTLS